MKSSAAILILALTLTSFTLFTGLKNILFEVDKTSTMTIKGTSNIHDWTANVEKINGTANLAFSDDGMVEIENYNISFDVNSIKSTKGNAMDKRIYKALKADTYSTINYKMKSLSSMKKTATGFTAKVEGNLTIAGTTKPVSVDITGKELANGNYEVSGSKALKMTTFNVEPPTAMLGALTTAD